MVKIYAKTNKHAEWELVGTFSLINGSAILKRYKRHFPSYLFKMVES